MPFILVAVGLQVSTQIFAAFMNYDTRVIGRPVLVVGKTKFYRALWYLLNYAKYAFNDTMAPYLAEAVKPFVYGFICAIVVVGILAFIRELVKRQNNLHGTARWGKEKDLRKNGLCAEDGVILGQFYKAKVTATKDKSSIVLKQKSEAPFVCHTGKINTLLLAPTGSGKGVSVIIPTLLSYPGSVIVFDPKGENYNITAGFRKQFSHALRFSPVSAVTLRFNPVAAIEGGAKAYRDANLISSILFAPSSTQSSSDTENFFSNSAMDLITTALLHIRFSDYPKKNFNGLLSLLSEISSGGAEEVAGKELWESMLVTEHYYLNEKGEKITDKDIHNIIAHGAKRQLAKNPKEQASVFSTAFAKIQLFEDPLIANATNESDFDISDFKDSENPISLYLTVPYGDLERLSTVFRLIITFMLKQFADGETQHGNVKLKNHLLFILDEFPTLGCFPFLEQVMGVLRGYGINFLIVCQSLGQLKKIYGEHHAFLDHCVTRVVFTPGNVSDAKSFVEEIGQQTVTAEKLSRSGHRFSGASNLNFSDNDFASNLINADELVKLPASDCLITSHGMPPYIAKKIAYYQDGRFKWKLDYKAPESVEELREEIKGLPSGKGKKIDEEGVIESEADGDGGLFDDDDELDAVMRNNNGKPEEETKDKEEAEAEAETVTRLVSDESGASETKLVYDAETDPF